MERDEQEMGQRLMYWTLWVSHTLAVVSVLLHNQASYEFEKVVVCLYHAFLSFAKHFFYSI